MMIVFQLIMVFICVKYPASGEKGSLFSHPISSFWNWMNFTTYFLFIAIFTIGMVIVSVIGQPLLGEFYTELIGSMALFVEAVLALPQVYKNWKSGTTEGLSWVLLATFVLGDAFKTFYFVYKGQPMQFVLCGAFQLFVDFVLIVQVLTEKKKPSPTLPRGGLLGY